MQNPHLNWREVVTSLDYPKFIVSSKKGLRLLIQAIHRGLGQEPFPIDLIYKPWNNTEGQVTISTRYFVFIVRVTLNLNCSIS